MPDRRTISDLGPLPAANKLKLLSSGSETIFHLRELKPTIKQQLSLIKPDALLHIKIKNIT